MAGHCVQDAPGAKCHPALRLPKGAVVVSKGMDPSEDACSAFQAEGAQGRPLATVLSERGVRHLYVGGLALNYCVRYSTLAAL